MEQPSLKILSIKNLTILVTLLLMSTWCLVMKGKVYASQENQAVSAQPAKKGEASEDVPSIHFAEVSHDFGQAEQNATLKHTFTFKNVGTGVLDIKKVKAS